MSAFPAPARAPEAEGGGRPVPATRGSPRRQAGARSGRAARDGLRDRVSERERQARLRWYFVLVGILLLMSVFSGGLFLYAVAVVTAVYLGSLAWAHNGLRQLRVWRSISGTEVELGAVVEVRVVVQNGKGVPSPWLLLHDEVESGLDVEGPRGALRTLDPGAKERLSYRLHTLRRGLFRVGPLVLESSDPFGLVRRYRVDSQAAFLTVLPRQVPLGRGWPLGHRPVHEVPRRRSLFEDPSRFLGIRRYQRGDSRRRIHWRATARSGSLQVKLFEPTVLDGMLLAIEMEERAYGSGGPRPPAAGDADSPPPGISPPGAGAIDPVEELVISAAASVGSWVVGGGQAIGVLSNGRDAAERYPVDWQGEQFRRMEDLLADAGRRQRLEGTRPIELAPGKGERQLRRLRTLLARLAPARGLGLGELLRLELPRLSRSRVLMVVTPHLDAELVSSLVSLFRSGFELGVMWVQPAGETFPERGPGAGQGPRSPDDAAALLPRSIPVHRIRGLADLEALGSRSL
ncbi:MAG: DUF58 domain-containing protein [Holophagales bacterium]|nr:DUF58 domain-containing protein [Holophagales bacterium]